ncbi:dodecin family protein [Anatilimnocola floriformis]|uniref:dodecin family protein n=1 Tax=Anatilimnocola floriformis TaxID=2948575 RepID=UPI0020C2F4F4|nr:dodecin family protein [Anatilimnocola floriformis]
MSKTIDHAKSPATIEIVEMVGVSKESWSDAAREAVERACASHRHVTGLDILHSTATISDGKIIEYHVNVKLAYITKPAKIEN